MGILQDGEDLDGILMTDLICILCLICFLEKCFFS